MTGVEINKCMYIQEIDDGDDHDHHTSSSPLGTLEFKLNRYGELWPSTKKKKKKHIKK